MAENNIPLYISTKKQSRQLLRLIEEVLFVFTNEIMKINEDGNMNNSVYNELILTIIIMMMMVIMTRLLIESRMTIMSFLIVSRQ